jgi:hypothetical protein
VRGDEAVIDGYTRSIQVWERATGAREGAPLVYREGLEAEHELLRQEKIESGGSVDPKG